VVMSPTARTLAECKRRGWIAQVVEQTIPRTFIKRDLFGIIDIIAITDQGPLSEIIGIQVTSGTNHAARVAKARREPRLSAWLGGGARFEVWSWSKRGARGKRKAWTLREEYIVSGMGQSP
jgi:hypothetical protein